MESHTWSIEQRHFQWPWTTPNPDFKVKPFFDAEYLRGSGMTCHWIRSNVRHIGIVHLISISTHNRTRHVILYQCAKFYPNRTTLRRKKWRHVILDFRGPIMVSLKTPCTTYYRSSIDTMALNCLVFEKIAFFAVWRQASLDRQTNGQHRCTKPLSLSRAAA